MASPLAPSIPFILFVLLLGFGSRSCYVFGSEFGFDIHHRYSDPVKGVLGVEGLPEKGSVEYYVAMAQRDRIIRGRHLAASNNQSYPLTFAGGNDTFRFLGHLHYANVSVGTPSLSFLVALDTGSDLFWLPCDCKKGGCIKGIEFSSGSVLLLNIYSPKNSSTSGIVPCNSSLCTQRPCPSGSSNCAYKITYLSSNTSSSGFLVDDVLHLVTDDDQLRAVDAPITFGCGQIQTGTFLEGAAINGLFGLGMDEISVPSTLARNGVASNSFSMCFSPDGLGRITFGNNGGSDQKETPFNVNQSYLIYNISITQITVGSNYSKLEFSAIFDSGTSFTILNDPAYTFISESFNSQVQEKRHSFDSQFPFEYCYDLSPNQYKVPIVNLTMKGGEQYSLTNPTELIYIEGGYVVYCLALLRSENINIIGQNFMTGYRIVFDRERMVLGWKDSNCYDNENSSTLAVSPSHSPAVSPAPSVNPEAGERSGSSSIIPVTAPSSHSPKLKPFAYALTVLLVSFFALV